MLNHLFDDPLVGVALMAVLVLFAGSVLFAIVTCFRPTLATKSPNLTYVATAVAGLVLSVASGVLGAPAKIPGAPTTVALAKTTTSDATAQEVQVLSESPQASDFKTLYAWSYVVLGLACLIVFMIPTASTHDLVKSVGLTTLGFLITLVTLINKAGPLTLVPK